ncbi:hypothetical protein HK098_005042 [Nowakowskiella sp. JEL0407]|nr:hypothetical protein HK098_005042 [Nowakowskiella sp. JEL0407]
MLHYQKNLLVQKQQVELEEKREERERLITPVKQIAAKNYHSSKLWFDPVARSIERVRLMQQSLNAVSTQSSTPQQNLLSNVVNSPVNSPRSSPRILSQPLPNNYSPNLSSQMNRNVSRTNVQQQLIPETTPNTTQPQ